jgi:hypothetical protein
MTTHRLAEVLLSLPDAPLLTPSKALAGKPAPASRKDGLFERMLA